MWRFSFTFAFVSYFLRSSSFYVVYWTRVQKNFAKVMVNTRSSLLEVFCKKAILKNFANFKGKYLCSFIKKRLQHRCFLKSFEKFLRIPPDNCFWNTCDWVFFLGKLQAEKSNLEHFAKFFRIALSRIPLGKCFSSF